MAGETYAAARRRVYDELKAKGWTVSKPELKVLWADPPSREYRLWFKAQAVYKDNHSLWFDIRGKSAQELIDYARK